MRNIVLNKRSSILLIVSIITLFFVFEVYRNINIHQNYRIGMEERAKRLLSSKLQEERIKLFDFLDSKIYHTQNNITTSDILKGINLEKSIKVDERRFIIMNIENEGLIAFNIYPKNSNQFVNITTKGAKKLNIEKESLALVDTKKSLKKGNSKELIDNKLIYMVAEPVFDKDNGELLGFIEFHYSLEYISNVINSFLANIFTKDLVAFSMMRYSDGVIDKIFSDNKKHHLIFNEIKNSKSSTIKFDDRELIVFNSKLFDNDCNRVSLVNVMDITEISKNMYHSTIYVITETIILLLLSIFVINIIFNLFANRVLNLNKRVTTILNIQQDILFVTTSDKLVEANEIFFKFFGFKDIDEFLSQHTCVCEYFENEDGYIKSKMGDLNWCEYLLKNPNLENLVKIKKDDKYYMFKIFAKELQSEDKKEIVVTMIDITKEQEREKALKKSEEFFKTIFQTFPDATMLVDIETKKPVMFNSIAYLQLGYNEEEFKTLSINDFDVIEKPEETKERIKNILKYGRDDFETQHLKKSGEIIDVRVTVQLIEIDNKTFIFSVFRDITTIKAYQKELIIAKREAEEANISKSQFLANMSHEIRTPMNAIIGLSDILLDIDLGFREHDYIKKINSSAKMLLRIINDILDYSKIEAKKMVLEKREFDISNIISQLKSLFTQISSDKGLELSINIQQDVPCVVIGDELRLTQVLTNLLSNAIKFSEKGVVKLNIELKEKIDSNRALVKFIVSDSGIGMSEEQINNLFKPFTQADSSTTRKYGGSGLGLAISQSIINACGGEITVQSAINRGTIFSFEIDFRVISWEKREQIGEKVTTKTLPNLSNIKVLLVEDNEINQDVAIVMLSKIGITPIVANNGKEAVDIVSANPYKFDIILMDLQMPIMSGYEATKIIREKNSKVPIIALTAAAMVEDREKAINAGMSDHLSKPIDAKALYDSLIHWSKFKNKSKIDMAFVMDMIDGNRELLSRLFDKFLKQLNGEFSNLANLIVSKNENAKSLNHSLKGVSGNLGAKELFEICQIIDNRFKLDEPILDSDIERLKNAISSLKAELENLNLKSTERKLEVSNSEFQTTFNKLKDDLLESNMINIDDKNIVCEILKKYLSGEDVEIFAQAIDDFDYKNALDIIQNIKI